MIDYILKVELKMIDFILKVELKIIDYMSKVELKSIDVIAKADCKLHWNPKQKPIVQPLLQVSPALPTVIFGVCSLIGAIATFFLPETAGKALPQTLKWVRYLLHVLRAMEIISSYFVLLSWIF